MLELKYQYKYLIRVLSRFALVIAGTVLICFFILTTKISALAGLAETVHTYRYSSELELMVGEPSDICGYIENKSKYCMVLVPNDTHGFSDDYPVLSSINLPTGNNVKYYVGQNFKDDKWIIAKAPTEQSIFSGGCTTIYNEDNPSGLKECDKNTDIIYESSDRSATILEWKRLGQPEPKILKLNEVKQNLSEKEQSKSENEFKNIFLAIPLIFGLVIVLSVLFAMAIIALIIFLILRHSKSHNKSDISDK